MTSSLILLTVALTLLATAFFLPRRWRKYTQRARIRHFVSAVDSAIALRLEPEMRSRTEGLQKLGESHPEASNEVQNTIKIRRLVRELAKFSSDLAELMQYQRGLKRLSHGEFHLDEAVTLAVRRFSQQHQSHQGEIILRLPDSASHIFVGCRETLQQLIVRLLEGVWFRGERGDIILGVELDERKAQTWVRIAVSSAFGHVSSGKAEELFLPFSTRNLARRGASDMELTLARHAAFLLHGTLRAKPTEHNGIALITQIPLTHILQPQPESPQAPAMEAGELPISGKNILLVDTSTSGASTLRGLLEKWNNTVEVFTSGREALHHIRTKNPTSTGNVYDYLFIDESTEDFEYAVVMHYVLSNPRAIRRVILIARRSPKASQREPGVHAVLEKPVSRDSVATLLATMERQSTTSPSQDVSDYPQQNSQRSTLPVVVPALDVRAEDLLRHVPEPQPKQKLRGLVVDDNLVNMHTIAGVLRQRSMDVLVAENGKDALEIFLENSQSLDFILMDVQMPEMDGCEATRRIRSFERERETRIPIIALTAYAKKEDRKRCLEAGMDDFISKGATPEALFEKINSLLTKSTHAPTSYIDDARTN